MDGMGIAGSLLNLSLLALLAQDKAQHTVKTGKPFLTFSLVEEMNVVFFDRSTSVFAEGLESNTYSMSENDRPFLQVLLFCSFQKSKEMIFKLLSYLLWKGASCRSSGIISGSPSCNYRSLYEEKRHASCSYPVSSPAYPHCNSRVRGQRLAGQHGKWSS